MMKENFMTSTASALKGCQDGQLERARSVFDLSRLSEAEKQEMRALGILTEDDQWAVEFGEEPHAETYVPREPVSAGEVINEAYCYARPSAFSRGIRIDLGEYALILISGTASVGEEGQTVHPGDFRAQTWRTFRNLTHLLKAAGATWHDVVRTTCYLRDIERDYKDFNEIRTLFYRSLGLNPLPASTGVQARLCRDDLLVEIEAIAVVRNIHPLPSQEE